ncbi:hypothetical protein VTN77DRAFT_6483 [Rasamsonia byssochlamydoides]|uniref:uncharacterized protein n=1 Tax=Rasamsonia byssochlamydoides TaxID=89139 RepID=UPI003741FB30
MRPPSLLHRVYLSSALAATVLLLLVQLADASPISPYDHTHYHNDRQDRYATLVKRGCFSSQKTHGLPVCSTLPTVAQLVDIIHQWGVVPNKDCLFYAKLGGGGAQDEIKQWYCNTITHGRGAVAYKDILPPTWADEQYIKLGTTKVPDPRNPQKEIMATTVLPLFLSQAFAEVCNKQVYFFTSEGNTGSNFEPGYTWTDLEYPALTRNAQVEGILQVDKKEDGNYTNHGEYIWIKGYPPSSTTPLGSSYTGAGTGSGSATTTTVTATETAAGTKYRD